MLIAGINYVTGQDRNEDMAVAHLYQGDFKDPGKPMCARGWNRSGVGYSIFRNADTGGICWVCLRRAEAKKPPVEPKEKKTKWL